MENLTIPTDLFSADFCNILELKEFLKHNFGIEIAYLEKEENVFPDGSRQQHTVQLTTVK